MKPFITIQLVLGIIFCLVLIPLYAQESVKPIIKKGSLKQYPNGNPKSYYTRSIVKIQGVSATGWIGLSENGGLQYCDLAESIQHLKEGIPAKSRVRFYPSGTLQSVLLSKNTKIQGLNCIGYGVESPEISFWPNGKIKTAYICKSTMIATLPAKGGSFAPVRFHENGALHSVVLSKETALNKEKYPPDTIVYFDAQGGYTKSYRHPAYKRLLYKLMDLVV